MEHSSDTKEETVKVPFTIFGEPVIKTRCQRNAFITGISGGIISGLVGFLVTSQIRKSMNIALGGYITVTFAMACYCTYKEYVIRNQGRMLKALSYQVSKAKKYTNSSDADTKVEST
ncbi:cytochrome c oxidase assembly factor COX20 lethal (3) 87Df [Megachile rotundata]|uniref:cytochrome c oxidase assembly factor COX20 lethal (3) 87Df n=1 Tax=Megachile rotundata TaxID=143995 RepID=UPI0006150E15|nr:PREDICTED: cytochrome c oxidase protein 20 homolog [Megachile rotundata]